MRHAGNATSPAAGHTDAMSDSLATFDTGLSGGGPGGEAAGSEAGERRASAAVVDRRWVGGSCPHVGCIPSKALLHSAAEHHANPAAYDWARASSRRDYMINRAADQPEP